MTHCCSSNHKIDSFPKTSCCPVNGETYQRVNTKTMLHHLLSPWKQHPQNQGFYFCHDPDCEVVYFGENKEWYSISELRTALWQKSEDSEAYLCHCFGITRKQAVKDPQLKQYVIEQTRLGLCSCETSNPSGRCCLKDFPSN